MKAVWAQSGILYIATAVAALLIIMFLAARVHAANTGANLGSLTPTPAAASQAPQTAVVQQPAASDSSSNQTNTSVTVNGHSVSVGANGSVDTTIQDGNQTSHISVQNTSSQSADDSSNSSTSNTTVNTEGQ